MNRWKDHPGKLDLPEKLNYQKDCIYKAQAYTSQVNVDIQLQKNQVEQATNCS